MMETREFGGNGTLNSANGVSVPPRRQEPVTRRYRPESEALDELVEVPRQLHLDAAANKGESLTT